MSQALSSLAVSQNYRGTQAYRSLKGTAMTFQPKEYASFSSLLWKRVVNRKTNFEIPHRWRWKRYEVYGIGVSPTGVGGRWYAIGIGLPKKVVFKSQFDAQAAVETYDLQSNVPEIDMNDVETVCDYLSENEPRSFEHLMTSTGLDAGVLSDAIARGYEVGMIALSIRGGYVLETRRR